MSQVDLGETYTAIQKTTNAAGTDTDATVTRVWVREHIDGTELEWTYTASGGATTSPTGFSSVIVRDSAGDYHLDFTPRKAERHTIQWVASGTVLVHPPETLFVRHSLIAALEP